jgi:hypothetical protein
LALAVFNVGQRLRGMPAGTDHNPFARAKHAYYVEHDDMDLKIEISAQKVQG